jgi:hypothetical protein
LGSELNRLLMACVPIRDTRIWFTVLASHNKRSRQQGRDLDKIGLIR